MKEESRTGVYERFCSMNVCILKSILISEYLIMVKHIQKRTTLENLDTRNNCFDLMINWESFMMISFNMCALLTRSIS